MKNYRKKMREKKEWRQKRKQWKGKGEERNEGGKEQTKVKRERGRKWGKQKGRDKKITWKKERKGSEGEERKGMRDGEEHLVVLTNHCLRYRCSTLAPDRQEHPCSSTCSLANTVWSTGSQFTSACGRGERGERKQMWKMEERRERGWEKGKGWWYERGREVGVGEERKRMEMGDGRKGMVRGERIRWKMGEKRRGWRWEIEFKGW